MKATIYHNPRCSKSRQTLQLLEANAILTEVIDYQKTPIDKSKLEQICEGLGIKPLALIRTKESLFKQLGLSINDQKNDDEWLSILVQHPKLIERPIVVIQGHYTLGRPPENVEKLIAELK